MTKVKMPDPVATRWRVPITDVDGNQIGESEWKLCATYAGLPWWTKDGLYTENQLQAYAAAKVREALEEAAQACEARIGTHAPGMTPEDVEDCDEEARLCAGAVRSLIPKE
ncbi:hypothetical protein ACMSSJ_11420 [Kerstersia gyiorum]|uniref:hypothetical protein n=1 Tax=Kerstersia gyiorum TaxID=206506 RepID=UPI0039E8386D